MRVIGSIGTPCTSHINAESARNLLNPPPPNITYVGSGAIAKKNGNSGTTLAVPIPTANSGDVLVLTASWAMQDNSSNQISTPAGWTLQSYYVETTYSINSQYLYTKTHNGSDTSLTLTHTTQGYSNRVLYAQIHAFRGVNTTTPILEIGTGAVIQTGTNNTTIPSTYSANYSIGIADKNAAILLMTSNNATQGAKTATPPAAQSGQSWIEIVDSNNVDGTYGDGSWFGGYYLINNSGTLLTPTNPTTATWNASFAAKNGTVRMFELQRAS